MQLKLFEEDSTQLLSAQIHEVMESHTKLRKSVFAQLSDHEKLFVRMQEQIEWLQQVMIMELKNKKPQESQSSLGQGDQL